MFRAVWEQLPARRQAEPASPWGEGDPGLPAEIPPGSRCPMCAARLSATPTSGCGSPASCAPPTCLAGCWGRGRRRAEGQGVGSQGRGARLLTPALLLSLCSLEPGTSEPQASPLCKVGLGCAERLACLKDGNLFPRRECPLAGHGARPQEPGVPTAAKTRHRNASGRRALEPPGALVYGVAGESAEGRWSRRPPRVAWGQSTRTPGLAASRGVTACRPPLPSSSRGRAGAASGGRRTERPEGAWDPGRGRPRGVCQTAGPTERRARTGANRGKLRQRKAQERPSDPFPPQGRRRERRLSRDPRRLNLNSSSP